MTQNDITTDDHGGLLMNIKPSLTVTKLSDANPGDLVIIRDYTGPFLTLVVGNPFRAGRLLLWLGPALAQGPEVPALTNFPPDATVISLRGDYELRLPCEAADWSLEEPRDGQCLVLCSDAVYIRAIYRWTGQIVRSYVEIAKGQLLVDNAGHFARPSGTCAYAAKWAFFTVEKEPRKLLSSGL